MGDSTFSETPRDIASHLSSQPRHLLPHRSRLTDLGRSVRSCDPIPTGRPCGQGSQRQENSRSMVDRAFGADRRSRARPYATRSVCLWRHEGSSVGRGNCHRCVHPLARLTNSLDERRNEAQDVGRSQEVLRDPEERAPACTLETPHPIGRLQPEYKRRQSAERRARGSALRVLG